MDANGTRYHLLLGYDDWASCLDPDGNPLRDGWGGSLLEDNHLQWDDERRQLILEPLLYLYVASPQDIFPKIEDRRGAGRDRYGNWYWIDASQQKVRVLSAGSQQPSDFWPVIQPPCPPHPDPRGFQPMVNRPAPVHLTFSGLSVTEDHYLVVGVLEPPGLLVFDLHASGPPEQLFWPQDIDFVPFDMSPRPGGGVWILDRQNCRYWALDGNFDVIGREQEIAELSPEREETFQAVDTPAGHERRRPPHLFPRGISLDDASPIDGRDPIAIEALPDCTVLILDRMEENKFSEISRYRFSHRIGDPVSTQVMQEHVEESLQSDFILLAHDFAFVPEHEGPDGPASDRLYVTSSNGNQTFAFTITGDDHHLRLSPLPELYLPMRLFSGKGLIATGEEVFYDMGERWLPLVRQSRPRYHTQATFTRTFDGHQPGCIWHRLMLDACIPPDCTVEIESRVAERDLSSISWQLEHLYLRGDGSELSYVPNPFQSLRSTASLSLVPTEAGPAAATGGGTWELLFQRAKGRYLQIRVTLVGQGQRTPRLRALRAYYPRFSYLEHYLPAVYRQESESASFLDRFLANLEGFFTAAEDKIAAVRLLFDVDCAPPEALDWLASWLGVALDPAWDDYRRRLFIHYALHFFQYRGTSYGLQMALHLALDECPSEEIFTESGVCCTRPGSLRIIEIFCNRLIPAVTLDKQTTTATSSSASKTSSPTTFWRPADGSAALDKRYQQLPGVGTTESYPLCNPGGKSSQPWQAFSQEVLGFIPSANPEFDVYLWRAYLAQRYATVDDYNQAHHLADKDQVSSFDNVMLPKVLPDYDEPLEDWYRFETVLLPMARVAHHFSVLLPMPTGATPDSPEYQRRLSLARRVIELEKPAHATYNIKFFWAMFRVGEARLGLDTLIDLGSRSPHWIPHLILGQGYLAESTLAAAYPFDVTDRLVLNRGCRSSLPPVVQVSQPEVIKSRTILKRLDDCWTRRSREWKSI